MKKKNIFKMILAGSGSALALALLVTACGQAPGAPGLPGAVGAGGALTSPVLLNGVWNATGDVNCQYKFQFYFNPAQFAQQQSQYYGQPVQPVQQSGSGTVSVWRNCTPQSGIADYPLNAEQGGVATGTVTATGAQLTFGGNNPPPMMTVTMTDQSHITLSPSAPQVGWPVINLIKQ